MKPIKKTLIIQWDDIPDLAEVLGVPMEVLQEKYNTALKENRSFMISCEEVV